MFKRMFSRKNSTEILKNQFEEAEKTALWFKELFNDDFI